MNQSVAFAMLVIPVLAFLGGCGDSTSPPAPPAKQEPEKVAKPKPEKQSLVPKTKRAGPVEHIEADERMAAVRLLEARDPVAHEIKIFDAEIRGAFDEKKFELLETTGDRLRESGELFGDGSWKIYHFYEAIDHRFHTGEDGHLTDLQLHRDWEKAFPDSLTRRIALANMLVSYAWQARGTGYANTVTPDGWKYMRERLDQAEKVLGDAQKLAGKDPYWFSTALTVGTGKSWDKGVFDKLMDDAHLDHPGYWHLATQRAYTLLPRWFGEEGDWEKFAVLASEVPGGLGDELYARIIIRMSGYDVSDVFRDSDAEWSRMKPGMEKLLEKYPESIVLRNEAAYHATLGRDREMAATNFESLGEEYVKSVWKKPERFVHFRTWAQTGKW